MEQLSFSHLLIAHHGDRVGRREAVVRIVPLVAQHLSSSPEHSYPRAEEPEEDRPLGLTGQPLPKSPSPGPRESVSQKEEDGLLRKEPGVDLWLTHS